MSGTLALIPARGGSQGVARKNLRLVGGVSLLARAIRACKQARLVDRILVSTEDREIADAALAEGAEVPELRPTELAQSTTSTMAVVQHELGRLHSAGALPRTLALVEPTSPFRAAAHLDAAIARFGEGDCGSVVSVTTLERKPQNIFVKQRYLQRYVQAPRETFSRRQDMAHLCRINSAVYVVAARDALAGSLLLEPIGFSEMDELASINIDSELDLQFADFVASRAAT